MPDLTPSELDAATGRHIRLEEYGCDDDFADLLPCTGVLEQRIEASGGVQDWYSLRLDEPLLLGGQTHAHLLIRSRRADMALGGAAEVSAYVLLVKNPRALERRLIEVKDFHHVGNVIVQPVAQRKPERHTEEEGTRIRCRKCKANYRRSQRRCPECGAAPFNPFSDEFSLVLKISAFFLTVGLLLWVVVGLDPSVPASLKRSSVWFKIPVALIGLLAIWGLIDLIVRRVFRR